MAMCCSNIEEMFKVLLFFMAYLLGYIVKSNSIVPEYCSMQRFSPKCNQNDVIIMKHALYGRMRKGKCMSTSTGLGCHINALPVLDEMCSNKMECDIAIHEDLGSLETPCPPEILLYLEADYACETVLQMDYGTCRSGMEIDVSSKISVSSAILAESNCGSSSLHFTAKPGQQLNISIIDFNFADHRNNQRSCVNYLELSEPSGKTEAVCAGSYERMGHVMISSGHDITAVFMVQDPRNQRFILTFEAAGCGDITPPEGTWVQRDGDETTLGCHSGRHSWTLRCENNQWKGAVGSCGTGLIVHQETSKQPVEEKWKIATGMLVFAAFSVLLLLCSTTFSIGVCVYTKGNKKNAQFSQPFTPQTLPLMAAHPRQSARTTIPPHQAMIEQQQFIPVARPDQTLNATRNTNKETGGDTSEQMYCNTMQSQTDSLYSDSVKYYVLESPQDKNGVQT